MNDQDALVAAIHEEVRLVSCNPAWPKAFAAERERLESTLPGLIRGTLRGLLQCGSTGA